MCFEYYQALLPNKDLLVSYNSDTFNVFWLHLEMLVKLTSKRTDLVSKNVG